MPQLYDLGRQGVGDVTASLIVGAGGREIGLAAEQLFGIEDVLESSIVPMPAGTGPLRQMAQLGTRQLLIIDVEALLADPLLGGASDG